MPPASRLSLALAVAVLICATALTGVAPAMTSHKGWPDLNGMLLMNKTDRARPLDARAGRDPFAGQDAGYSCDAIHERGRCKHFLVPGPAGGLVVGPHKVHHELLGGHGSDTLFAGRYGDVLWGDYKEGGQPTGQRDRITGGAGADYIYASHGWNTIDGRGGNDYIKAHYGRGIIDCGGGARDRLFISRRAQPGYRIRGCETVSHKTLGR